MISDGKGADLRAERLFRDSPLTAGNVRQVLPNYDARLKLPGKKEPTFVGK